MCCKMNLMREMNESYTYVRYLLSPPTAQSILIIICTQLHLQ